MPIPDAQANAGNTPAWVRSGCSCCCCQHPRWVCPSRSPRQGGQGGGALANCACNLPAFSHTRPPVVPRRLVASYVSSPCLCLMVVVAMVHPGKHVLAECARAHGILVARLSCTAVTATSSSCWTRSVIRGVDVVAIGDIAVALPSRRCRGWLRSPARSSIVGHAVIVVAGIWWRASGPTTSEPKSYDRSGDCPRAVHQQSCQ